MKNILIYIYHCKASKPILKYKVKKLIIEKTLEYFKQLTNCLLLLCYNIILFSVINDIFKLLHYFSLEDSL